MRALLPDLDGLVEPVDLLPRYIIVLAVSAGMTLSTCFAVFKWDNVKRDAGHGTMFMVFFCWYLWSIVNIWRTIVVYLDDRQDTLENPTIRKITILTEVFFNAISMWYMVATYEFQRRALSPRTENSHRACLIWNMLIIGGISISLLIVFYQLNQSGDTVIGDEDDPFEVVAWSAVVLSKYIWVSWAIRCFAAFYSAFVALWLHCRRDLTKIQGLPRSLSLIVAFFFVLNVPYLILGPLVKFDILSSKAQTLKILGFSKTISYLSGVAISLVMGFSIRGFDEFYNTRRSLSFHQVPIDSPHDSRDDSFFVISHDEDSEG